MFSLLLSPEGRMALRLSEEEREKFLKKYKTTLFEAYGTVMKERSRSRRLAKKDQGAAEVSAHQL